MTSSSLDVRKDPVSTQGHVLSYWGSGLQYVFWEGTQFNHNDVHAGHLGALKLNIVSPML